MAERDPGDLKISHDLEQDAIRECMALAGFEFEPWPFVPVRAEQVSSTDDVLAVRAADSLGYWLTLSTLEFYTPLVAPPEAILTAQQFDAYNDALWGAVDHSHGEDDGHSHEGVESHTHGGCAAVGRQARLDNGDLVSDSNRLVRAVFEALLASGEYAEFSKNWGECLVALGYEPRASSPHLQIGRYHIAEGERFVTEVARLHAAEDASGPIHAAISQSVLDASWVRSITDAYPPLHELLEAEIAEATADQECRNEHRSIILPVIEAAFDDDQG